MYNQAFLCMTEKHNHGGLTQKVHLKNSLMSVDLETGCPGLGGSRPL